jgi:hypothetical protein
MNVCTEKNRALLDFIGIPRTISTQIFSLRPHGWFHDREGIFLLIDKESYGP